MLVSVDLQQSIARQKAPKGNPGIIISLFGNRILLVNAIIWYSYSFRLSHSLHFYCTALISFGYMVPWVAIGSLIRYFTEKYGDSYFVILNVAFYAVGYPISYLQRKADLYYDTVYGSKQTFRRRMEICMAVLGVCTIMLPFIDGLFYVVVVTIIGIFTWSAHGVSSSLASVVKHNSNIVQQIGFALPGAFALAMGAGYHLSDDSRRADFIQFYALTAGCVLLGLISWVSIGASVLRRYGTSCWY